MSKYVDGFVIPIAKNKVAQYKKIAAKAGKIWMKNGALAYFETTIDESTYGVPFAKMAKCKPNQTVVFSWIVYKNKAHRNKVNKQVMNDPWIQAQNPTTMPIDMKKMAVGGFKVLVEAK